MPAPRSAPQYEHTLCPSLSLTKPVAASQTALTLAQCPALVDTWAEAALAINPEVLVLVHGGPVSEPQDAQYVLQHTRHCHGFYGASSMERLPTERALTEQTRKFKDIRFA